MAGFASYAQLAQYAAGASGETTCWTKDAQSSLGATLWCSTWYRTGSIAAGAAPPATPGVAYVNGSGGITYPSVTPARRFLTTYTWGNQAQVSSLMLYDRLVGVGSLAINSVGNRTVNSVALPRYSDGFGVQAWVEVSSALTVSTALQLSLSSYTNQDGVTGRVGAPLSPQVTSLPVGALFGPLPLAPGDLGVRSVEVGLGVAGTVPATGSVNLVLLKPLMTLPGFIGMTASYGGVNERDTVLMSTRLPRLYDGATLGFAMLAYSATTGTNVNVGALSTVWG